MYTFKTTEHYLTHDEKSIFNDYLIHEGLDSHIWEIFSCLCRASTKNTKPLLLKAYDGNNLIGCTIIIRCSKYGKALFNNRLLSGLTDLIHIPCYLWVKFGCCMDMLSNPGFVKDPDKADEVFQAMATYLKKNNVLSIINDYSDNKRLYSNASMLPALPHALVNCSHFSSVDEYLNDHKNIKRKLRVFKNKDGDYKRIASQLSREQKSSMKKCFLSTVEKSVFYLPYQDLYLSAALETSATHIDEAYYFVATLNNEFIGYQAAVMTGNHLNALHGAFDRQLKTTYHAYDILFVKMTEFAIEHNLTLIDFGAVLNETKRKMINKRIDMSYFIMSKYTLIQWFFNLLLSFPKIQSKQQLKFR